MSNTPTQDAPKEKGVPVELLRGYCAEESVKTPKGEIIKLPAKEAQRLIDLEVAKRADKLTEE